MTRFPCLLAAIAVSLFGCGTGDADGAGSPYDEIEARYLGAFDVACGTANACYGPSESTVYQCELYVSTVRFGIDPAIHGYPSESDCYRSAYDVDPAGSTAFWECQIALEADFASCLRSCPRPTDTCHVGRGDARRLCAAGLPDALRTAMEGCR